MVNFLASKARRILSLSNSARIVHLTIKQKKYENIFIKPYPVVPYRAQGGSSRE